LKAAVQSLRDCSGLVLPSPPRTTVDGLVAAAAARRARRAEEMLERATALLEPGEQRVVADALRTLEAMAQVERVAAFATPLASWDVEDAPVDGPADRRPAPVRALGLVRHLVGRAPQGSPPLVLAPRAFAAGPLLLPHLRLLSDGGGGPVVATQESSRLRLTWEDGRSATLPCDGLPEGEPGLPHLRAVPVVGTAMVLNDCAEIAAPYAAWQLARPSERRRAADALADGLALLRAVWPAAADMAERFFRGVLLLRPREGTRSHSPPELYGTVVESADAPAAVGDLLCHELAHVRLNQVLAIDPLLYDDGIPRHRSPWRPDLRPLKGVLLGVHAFLDVCHYHRRLSEHAVGDGVSEAIYERQRAKVCAGLDLLLANARPTVLGEQLLTELEREVAVL
jgi:HEXXH motif-containing protein